MRAQTILYLDHTAKWSGGEIALHNLLTAMDAPHYMPLVALAADGPLTAALCRAGVETQILSLDGAVIETRKDSLGASSLLRARLAVSSLTYAVRLARFARVRGVALIHTNSLKSDIYGGLAGRLARIPVVWHVRDHIDAHYLPGPVAALFRRLASLFAHTVVVNSQSTRRTLTGVRADRLAVVHDGCYPNPFADSAVDSSGPTVTLVGRLTPWKGQDVFLRAAARVLKAHPQARFQIVGTAMFGEDAYARSLPRLAETLGIGARVAFLGFRDDVPHLLAASTLVVHASTLGEPFGQVVIEGMAAGKPVVATDGGALPEIVVDGETGRLVPCGDDAAMAAAIVELLSDPARVADMGAAGKARVAAQFDIRRTAQKVVAVYDRILGSRVEGHELGKAVT